jgi:hypothetical protein
LIEYDTVLDFLFHKGLPEWKLNSPFVDLGDPIFMMHISKSNLLFWRVGIFESVLDYESIPSCVSFSFSFFQICDVAMLGIIHKRN